MEHGMLKSGRYAMDVSILGVTNEDAEEFGIELSEGEIPGGGGSNTYEMVMGAWTLNNFYDPDNYRPAVDSKGNPRVTSSSRIQLTFDYRNIYQSQMDYSSGDNGDTRPLGSYYKVKVTGVRSAMSAMRFFCSSLTAPSMVRTRSMRCLSPSRLKWMSA